MFSSAQIILIFYSRPCALSHFNCTQPDTSFYKDILNRDSHKSAYYWYSEKIQMNLGNLSKIITYAYWTECPEIISPAPINKVFIILTKYVI